VTESPSVIEGELMTRLFDLVVIAFHTRAQNASLLTLIIDMCGL